MKLLVPTVRISVLCIVLTIFSARANSQSIVSGDGRWEAGVGFGPMFFLGDLGGSAGVGKPFVKDLDFPLTDFSKNLFVIYSPKDWLALRLSINHGVLKGDDAQAPAKGGAEMDRKERNLSFRSSVLEAFVAAEIYPTVLFETYQHRFRPYGIIGIGAFKFNPKAKLDGQWVALHELRLEGQGMAEYPDRKPYSLIQMEIPMGVGFKYYIKENMYTGLELVHRKLFTDYIDDVSTGYVDPTHFDTYLSPENAAKARRLYYRGTYSSAVTNPGNIQTFQRGDPSENDAFFSMILRIGFHLNSSMDSRTRKQLKCPSFF